MAAISPGELLEAFIASLGAALLKGRGGLAHRCDKKHAKEGNHENRQSTSGQNPIHELVSTGFGLGLQKGEQGKKKRLFKRKENNDTGRGGVSRT